MSGQWTLKPGLTRNVSDTKTELLCKSCGSISYRSTYHMVGTYMYTWLLHNSSWAYWLWLLKRRYNYIIIMVIIIMVLCHVLLSRGSLVRIPCTVSFAFPSSPVLTALCGMCYYPATFFTQPDGWMTTHPFRSLESISLKFDSAHAVFFVVVYSSQSQRDWEGNLSYHSYKYLLKTK